MLDDIECINALQTRLNEFITPNWIEVRTLKEWAVACMSEIQEAIDTQKWKWWKKSSTDDDRLLLELVDILHFSTSGYVTQSQQPPRTVGNYLIPVASLDVAQFRDSDTLSQLVMLMKIATFCFEGSGNFADITNGVLMMAKSRDMPIMQNYFAKHCLNYIRQLKGYKTGLYKKPENEDSLLHNAAGFYDSGLSHSENYDTIASYLYDAYNIEFPLRLSFEQILEKTFIQ
jgi:dUTP pyrophosphatase